MYTSCSPVADARSVLGAFVLIESLTEHACSANVFILKEGRSQSEHFSRSGLRAAFEARAARSGKGRQSRRTTDFRCTAQDSSLIPSHTSAYRGVLSKGGRQGEAIPF